MSRRLLIAGAAALAVGAAGCGSSGYGGASSSSAASSSAAGTSASASSNTALCDTASDLRTSITALQQVDVVQQGTDAVQTAFDQVSKDISAVADAARDHFTPQVALVQADRAAVQAALSAAKAAPNAATLGALRAAVQKLVQDVQSLLSAVGSTC